MTSATFDVVGIGNAIVDVIAHADEQGKDAFVPRVDAEDLELRPLLDFEAGYVLRALDRLPKQGSREPWFLAQDYFKDAKYLRDGSVTDDAMEFFSATPVETELQVAA